MRLARIAPVRRRSAISGPPVVAIAVLAGGSALTGTIVEVIETQGVRLGLVFATAVLTAGATVFTVVPHARAAMLRQRRPAPPVLVSCLPADRTWGLWIADALSASGYDASSYIWSSRIAADVNERAKDAFKEHRYAIVLVSRAFIATPRRAEAWVDALRDQQGDQDRTVLVQIERGEMAGETTVDITGQSAQRALEEILDALAFRGGQPGKPGPDGPDLDSFPGRGPQISNIAPRNTAFTGRADQMEDLYEFLHHRAGVGQLRAVAICGLGGIGKTEFAREYAHRFGAHYDITWEVRADTHVGAVTDLIELARRLGMVDRASHSEMLMDLWNRLRQRDRWLLVYDDASGDAPLTNYWPQGGAGHVLLTSRTPGWEHLTQWPLQLSPLAPDKARIFLQQRTGSADADRIARIAELLGRLPLALEQAAAYISSTGTSLDEYLDLLEHQPHEVLSVATSDSQPVALTWSVSLKRALQEAPQAHDLLALCSYLAADDIPAELLKTHQDALPEPLAAALSDQVRRARTVRALTRYSLLTVNAGEVNVHPLVQTVVRSALPPARQREWARTALLLLNHAFPYDVSRRRNWSACGRLIPHVQAAGERAEAVGVIAREQEPHAGFAATQLLHRAGEYLLQRCSWQQARLLLEQARTARERVLGEAEFDVADTLEVLATTKLQLAELEAAEHDLVTALEIRKSALGGDDPQVAETLLRISEVVIEAPDFDRALAAAREALRIYQAAFGPQHVTVAQVLHRIGVILRKAGRPGAARLPLERSLEIHQAQAKPRLETVAFVQRDLALIHQDLRDLERARETLERSAALMRKALGRDHFELARTNKHLADVLRRLGYLDDAAALLNGAIAVHERQSVEGMHQLAACLNKRGSLELDRGDPASARATLERAAGIYRDVYGSRHPYVAKSLARLGPALRALGRVDEAEQVLRDAADMVIERFGEGHVLLAAVYESLAGLVGGDGYAERADQVLLAASTEEFILW